ncbi:MAG: 50S ribosomal protein L19 [Phycisphaerae bacterium]|nr:MAG: 50S ribosomal protein L19 [Phycisphaerae bacterium]
MSQQLMEMVEQRYQKASIPEFRVGDTVDVHQKIVEGNKTRTQVFNGVVIARKGRGINETFTVRRIVNNEGVERVFPCHSRLIGKIDVKRRGKVRRAKLYFLRDRVGKARKLRELRSGKAATKANKAKAAPDSKPDVQTQDAEPVGV